MYSFYTKIIVKVNNTGCDIILVNINYYLLFYCNYYFYPLLLNVLKFGIKGCDIIIIHISKLHVYFLESLDINL